MKNYVIRKAILAVSLFIAFMAIEVLTFRFLAGINLPTLWYIDVGVFFLISCFVFVMPFMVQVVLSNIFLLFHYLLALTNLLIFNSSGRYFDWGMLKLVSETLTVGDMVKVPVAKTFLLSIVFVGFLLFSILIKFKQKKLYYKKFVHKFVFVLSLGLMTSVIVIEAFIPAKILRTYDNDSYFTSPSFMFSTFESAVSSLNAFGFWGYYFHSALRTALPSLTPELKDITAMYSEPDYTSVLSGICEGDNVIFILAESFENYVISKSTTPVLYALKNGIDLSDEGISNFYDVTVDGSTGQKVLTRKDYDNDADIFSGLNLGEVGLVLTDYKSIESTNYSEMRVLTGNYNNAIDGASISEMLDQEGYTTNYIHGNYDWFYKRGEYMSGDLGFMNTLFYDDMVGKVESSNALSFFLRDRDILSYYLAHEDEFDIVNDEQFLTFFMTVSTHGNYEVVESTEPLISEYLEKFDTYIANASSDDSVVNAYKNFTNEELKNYIRTFMASAIDTEEMVALLIDELYCENKLDDTVLVFVSDHYAYGSNAFLYKEYYLREVVGLSEVRDSDIHTLPAFIYSTKIKNEDLEELGYSRVVDHLTSAFDLVPTVLTLLNVEYNKLAYMGYPVINTSVETGECIYNAAGYSSTNGIFFDDYFSSVSGTNADFNGLSAEEVVRMKKVHEYINKYYAKKYYVYEMSKRGWLD